MTKHARFRGVQTSPDIIRLVIIWNHILLPLPNARGLLHEGDIEISHETLRHWWR